MSKKNAESRLVDWSVFLMHNTNKYGYEYEEIERYQLRLTKGDIRIDIFPKSKKFFDITNQKWGEIGELNNFLQSRFDTHETPIIDYKAKYEKCIEVIKKFDAGIIGMYDL